MNQKHIAFKLVNNPLVLFLIFTSICLYFDSRFFVFQYPSGQWISNTIMLLVFFYLFYKANNRYRELMLYATGIGVIGECLLSLGFEMYAYRLDNVPVYVPPGHAVVYVTACYFCKDAVMIAHKKFIERLFQIFIIVFSTAFLILKQDIFGFVMTLLTFWFLRNRTKERFFFLTMYVVVTGLELIGTFYKCWVWPSTAFGYFTLLKSANPPSGISFCYFALDLGCLWFYKQRHITAWNRMKNIRLKQQILN